MQMTRKPSERNLRRNVIIFRNVYFYKNKLERQCKKSNCKLQIRCLKVILKSRGNSIEKLLRKLTKYFYFRQHLFFKLRLTPPPSGLLSTYFLKQTTFTLLDLTQKCVFPCKRLILKCILIKQQSRQSKY